MKESDIQREIMNYLLDHPLIAWAFVTTTGQFKLRGGSYTKIGFPGLSDIIGQMTDGRMIAIEVKLPGKQPTQDQLDFLDTVNSNNGLGIWVDNIKGVINTLDSKR